MGATQAGRDDAQLPQLPQDLPDAYAALWAFFLAVVDRAPHHRCHHRTPVVALVAMADDGMSPGSPQVDHALDAEEELSPDPRNGGGDDTFEKHIVRVALRFRT